MPSPAPSRALPYLPLQDFVIFPNSLVSTTTPSFFLAKMFWREIGCRWAVSPASKVMLAFGASRLSASLTV